MQIIPLGNLKSDNVWALYNETVHHTKWKKYIEMTAQGKKTTVNSGIDRIHHNKR